jgi:hypothetical protein
MLFLIFPALHWILSPEVEAQTSLPVQLVEDLMMREEYVHSSVPLQWLRRALVVNPEQVTMVAEKTKGQRDNPLWAAVRKLRFTASNFGDLLKAVDHKRLVLYRVMQCMTV